MTKKKIKTVIYFTEQQNIQRFYIRLVLLFEIIFFSGMLYRQIIEGKPVGPYPVTNSGLLLLAVLLTLPVLILFFVRVKIKVTNRQIEYYMMPAGIFRHHITREELKDFNIETPKGKITGIKLRLKNGKALFLPTQKPEKLQLAIEKMMHDNP
ncbi:hypothetical protein LA303_10045 [Candidatus Sulfidibacterium hydrothermale]|uniref:hypothetical protein n=1 Tax=Candidatus Sulfidibacterium hydrothermale TaxID=2875962 RepID=UPI001F0B1616|nr:hypothetical protein [Candidatus Sulfidibacterium hydrothermale]UBM61744.1 hypothetical protein LA303_10045 [Candidatus Sulfidibacterium hydrothermale]